MIDQRGFGKGPWGWLPFLSVTAAFGVLVTALAKVGSLNSSPVAMLVFWFGVIAIVAPIGLRMLNLNVKYPEALALSILAGEALFLVSAILSSSQNSGYDAFLHFRTARDILTTAHLFTPNPLLPVSPYYPGLEIVTTALVNLTGLSIFQAGSVVVFAARWIMISSLFMILFMLSGSARAAGIGTLVYMGSSTFVFFDSQFAYESLSLPLTALVLWLVLKRSFTLPVNTNWAHLAILTGIMVAITHHIMSYFMAGILLLWTVFSIIRNQRRNREYNPWRPTLILGVFVLAWLFLVAEITVGYLSPYIHGTQETLLKFLSGYQGDRSVFTVNQTSDQLLERIASIVSVVILILGLGIGALAWLKWHKTSARLESTLAVVLGLTGLLYPLLPVLRLNDNTWEVANRLAGAVFIGMGFVVGLGIARTGVQPGSNRLQRRLVVPALTLIVIAGIIGGTHPATRLPGPYMVEADGRSFDAYSLSAANWAETTLGPGHRMTGDREQSLLMGSLGGQTMVFSEGKLNLSPIFLRPALTPGDIQVMKNLRLQYLVIDQRITQGAPLYGYYFESWEQMVYPTQIPLDPAALAKFDTLPNVSRVYDNGSIHIYDIRGISLAP